MKLIRYSFAYLALSIALGAFGAHSLKTKLTPADLTIFKTGQEYQTIAAFTLILVGILLQIKPNLTLKWQTLLFFCGSIIFSLSLYLLSTTGAKILGAITPIGGVLMISSLIGIFVALGKLKEG